jgi:hypothetical protein
MVASPTNNIYKNISGHMIICHHLVSFHLSSVLIFTQLNLLLSNHLENKTKLLTKIWYVKQFIVIQLHYKLTKIWYVKQFIVIQLHYKLTKIWYIKHKLFNISNLCKFIVQLYDNKLFNISNLCKFIVQLDLIC